MLSTNNQYHGPRILWLWVQPPGCPPFPLHPCPIHQQDMPSPGGQVSGMADPSAKPGRWGGGVWHPADLPEGYHAAPRRQAWTSRPRVGKEMLPPGRRVVGLRQVDGMPPGSQRARSSVVAGRPEYHDGGQSKIRPFPGRETSSSGKNR